MFRVSSLMVMVLPLAAAIEFVVFEAQGVFRVSAPLLIPE